MIMIFLFFFLLKISPLVFSAPNKISIWYRFNCYIFLNSFSCPLRCLAILTSLSLAISLMAKLIIINQSMRAETTQQRKCRDKVKVPGRSCYQKISSIQSPVFLFVFFCVLFTVCEKVTWATLIYLLKTKEKPNNKRKRCGGRVIIMRNNEKGGVGGEEKRKTKKK